MAEGADPGQVPLAAKSPFELRVNLGKDVPETDVKTALANGDMGFLHSYTTGSAVDGPGIRVVAWTTGCMWRCLYCHNPDTWTMRNGHPIAVIKAVEELRKYQRGLKAMSGGFTISGGEPLMQDRFAVKLLAGAKTMKLHTAIETSAYVDTEHFLNALRYVNFAFIDVKPRPAPQDVVAAQKALTELGYGPLKADGDLGPGTRQAIEKYQRDAGLKVTGELHAETLQVLLDPAKRLASQD